MQSMRTTVPYLRLALAGLLAVVSLIQVPSMVFAWSGAVPFHHEIAIASHNHHEAVQPSHEHHGHGTADDARSTPACHLVGCCLALSLPACGAPTAPYLLLLGPLDAASARPMVATPPDPADPPPRLQA